jgi:hypothetical protein
MTRRRLLLRDGVILVALAVPAGLCAPSVPAGVAIATFIAVSGALALVSALAPAPPLPLPWLGAGAFFPWGVR